MASDIMRVRLHLRLIRVLAVLVDTASRLEVEVISTRSWSRCPFCGFKTRTVHDRRRRKIRDLPVSGRRTTLVWIRRRFACGNCDERHLETHREFEGGLTRRLARGLIADAKVMSIRSVVRRHGVDWHLIQALVTSWSATVAEHRRARRCRVLLVDETSMRKRHRYVTVIQDGETGQILAMVEHRNAAALSGFLIERGPKWCRGVKVVVSDGSKTSQDRHRSTPRPCPPRTRPVPCDPLVRRRPHPRTTRSATPRTSRGETYVRSRRVPGPVPAAQTRRHPQ